MFSGEGEAIIITNTTPFTEAKHYLNGHIQHFDSILSFTVKLCVTLLHPPDEIRTGIKLHCSFPRGYPISASPRVRVICDGISNSSHINFDNKLSEHINSIPVGEQCSVLDVIEWIQENINKYIQINSQPSKPTNSMTNSTNNDSLTLSRIWIYSHHIYSIIKRKNILNWAEELKLTGFSLPGKPGIIHAEGNTSCVDEFYSRLKALNWKRLSCKLKEDLGIVTSSVEKKFSDFQEISFDPHGSRDYHMDLGKFFQFLKDHGLEDKFQILFGVKGTASKVYS
ncbi:hypothetical protein LOD99_2511 [Oopsacas minuta]|uniref:RWD domain-containing protein 2B n=1 Tax=Oopsacas minuta TaxID=111878 RepID=A0AAV7K2R3_9METZ|nr:hypothetical protein LOD99_2511 [Oopsacas minuta]